MCADTVSTVQSVVDSVVSTAQSAVNTVVSAGEATDSAIQAAAAVANELATTGTADMDFNTTYRY